MTCGALRAGNTLVAVGHSVSSRDVLAQHYRKRQELSYRLASAYVTSPHMVRGGLVLDVLRALLVTLAIHTLGHAVLASAASGVDEA